MQMVLISAKRPSELIWKSLDHFTFVRLTLNSRRFNWRKQCQCGQTAKRPSEFLDNFTVVAHMLHHMHGGGGTPLQPLQNKNMQNHCVAVQPTENRRENHGFRAQEA